MATDPSLRNGMTVFLQWCLQVVLHKFQFLSIAEPTSALKATNLKSQTARPMLKTICLNLSCGRRQHPVLTIHAKSVRVRSCWLIRLRGRKRNEVDDPYQQLHG
mmetsp:Transcript_1116/g.710  ORF Transcript_1116/g.710 Transcript_1116/m.710 type:complete len:104 (-) Transcript_1116:103-414(-)